MGVRNMFLRSLSTLACVVVTLAAVAVIDCASAAIDLIDGDSLGLCGVVDSVGADYGFWAGVVLAVLAIAGLVLTWAPALRPGARRRRLTPESSLNRNLARVADAGSTETDSPRVPYSPVGRLIGRLEALEAALATDETPSRELTQEWMALLRTANDLHNRDELAAQDFKKLNTRLLDLFVRPSEDDELARTS